MKSKWVVVLAIAGGAVLALIYVPNVVKDPGAALDRAIDIASSWIQRWSFI